MGRLAVCVALVALLATVGVAHAQFKVTIVHTGELRGNILEDSSQIGGFARVAKVLSDADALAADGRFVIKVDVGGQMGTTVWDLYYNGKQTPPLQSAAGYHARSIGLSDLHQGPFPLSDNILDITTFMPTVLSNINIAPSQKLATQVKKFAAVNVTNSFTNTTLRVGFVGMSKEDVCLLAVCYSGTDTVISYSDAATAVNSAVAALKASTTVDLVISLVPWTTYAHVQSVMAAVNGVDIWIADGGAVNLGAPDGPLTNVAASPVVATQPNGKPTYLIGQGDYRYVGVANFTFNSTGYVTAAKGVGLYMRGCSKANATKGEGCVDPLPSVNTTITNLQAAVDVWRKQPIGSTTSRLEGDVFVCRFSECNLGNFIADAMRKKNPTACQIAFINSGGIRASINAGNITLESILSVLPFRNLMSSFQIDGALLLQVLQNSVSLIPTDYTNSTARTAAFDNGGTGRFFQVSGIRFSYDPTKPVGQRIIAAETENVDKSWSRLDTKRNYKVCSPDIDRKGGDNYAMLVTGAIDPYDNGAPLDVIMREYVDYFTGLNTPITYTTNGRINITVLNTTSNFYCSLPCVNGRCVAVDRCSCDLGWTSARCDILEASSSTNIAVIVAPAVCGAVLLFVVIGFVVARRMRAGFHETEKKMWRKDIALDELIFGDKIGEGASGVIFKGTWRGTTVAIKQWIGIRMLEDATNEELRTQDGYAAKANKAMMSMGGSATGKNVSTGQSINASKKLTVTAQSIALSAFDAFQDEIAIMCSLRHPNVLLYMGTCPPPNLCIVTEFMGRGSLDGILHNKALELDWPLRVSLAQQIALGLNYLHMHDPPIMHCDLKSMNILVDDHWVAKVCDFGLTRFKEKKQKEGGQGMVGTLLWMAPEVLQGLHYNEKSDTYSYGMILYEIASRRFPFEERLEESGKSKDGIELLLSNICEGMRPKLARHVPRDYVVLVEQCWHENEEKRAELSKVADALTKLLSDTFALSVKPEDDWGKKKSAPADVSNAAPKAVEADERDKMVDDALNEISDVPVVMDD